MPESFDQKESTQEATTRERDFVANPATPNELADWTEQYRVTPDLEPVAFAEPPASPDLSIFEELQGVPKGQELVPVSDMGLFEGGMQTPDYEVEAPASFGQDLVPWDAKAPPALAEEFDAQEEGAREEPAVQEAGVEEVAVADREKELQDMLERLAAQATAYAPTPIQQSGQGVRSGFEAQRYTASIEDMRPQREALTHALAELRKAIREGDSARIAELERQVAELQKAPTEAGEEAPIPWGAEKEPGKEMVLAGNDEVPDGEYIPRGSSGGESSPRLVEDKGDLPALEYQPGQSTSTTESRVM